MDEFIKMTCCLSDDVLKELQDKNVDLPLLLSFASDEDFEMMKINLAKPVRKLILSSVEERNNSEFPLGNNQNNNFLNDLQLDLENLSPNWFQKQSTFNIEMPPDCLSPSLNYPVLSTATSSRSPSPKRIAFSSQINLSNVKHSKSDALQTSPKHRKDEERARKIAKPRIIAIEESNQFSSLKKDKTITKFKPKVPSQFSLFYKEEIKKQRTPEEISSQDSSEDDCNQTIDNTRSRTFVKELEDSNQQLSDNSPMNEDFANHLLDSENDNNEEPDAEDNLGSKHLSDPKTVDLKALRPTRVFENSIKYNTAIRLDQKNVSAEVIEAILFDCFEGELILAEYEENSVLEPNTQQKLVDILIARSSKHLVESKKLNEYFSKLADSILMLFPEEEKDTYYIPPNSYGNDSKNPKGKLPDKWRNLTFRLRKHKILPKCSSDPSDGDDTLKLEDIQDRYLTDEIEKHMKWLKKYREPVEAKKRWKLTYKYRADTRALMRRSISDCLTEWPILKSDLGLSFINEDFQLAYENCDPSAILLWESFFNELYTLKKSAVRDANGKKIVKAYEDRPPTLTNSQVEGLQILALPYLLPAANKVKTGAGTIKPSLAESADGFVVWAKTHESVITLLDARTARYEKWQEKAQPCIVLEGPSCDSIKNCYVSLEDHLWKVESPAQALDYLFKLFMIFNLKYPVDCELLWLVVQKALYSITTKKDKRSPTISSLTNILKKKLEIEEASDKETRNRAHAK